ncbi:hypothetical protein [Dactylosporangium sp. NPDC051541]|uniref:hypothetical protein n=1 Tax=Dactylosporangium sp. NPDC051541 TaxID=3363977 RepID=UPI00379B77CD
MRTSAALRTAAVGLALTLCGLLLGLSHAHNALPGDTFQVARTASATAAVHGTEAAPPVTAPDPVTLDPGPQRTEVPAGPQDIHCGRIGEATGCRGPPTS